MVGGALVGMAMVAMEEMAMVALEEMEEMAMVALVAMEEMAMVALVASGAMAMAASVALALEQAPALGSSCLGSQSSRAQEQALVLESALELEASKGSSIGHSCSTVGHSCLQAPAFSESPTGP